MGKIIGFILSVSFVCGLILTYPTKNPHLALAIPQVSKIFLSGPLTLSLPSAPVLGAQTIDPQDFINAVNAERVKNGAKPLRVSVQLMKAAQMRADAILKHQNFSHQDPYEGVILTSVLPKVNYHYAYAAENIGMGGTSGPNFVDGFMHSTSHRYTLLDPNLVDTGAAIVEGPYNQYYVNIAVQLFAIPGGKEETLGYSTEEMKHYKEELDYLDNQLNPVRWLVGKMTQNSFYSDARYIKLLKEKEILANLYQKMTGGLPFTNDDVLLVVEYNKLSAELTEAPPG